MEALLQHRGPLKHVNHAHRFAKTPTPTPTCFTYDEFGRVQGLSPWHQEPERTPEEEKQVLEWALSDTNQNIAAVIAIGQAYEALLQKFREMADHNGGHMTTMVGIKFNFYLVEIDKLSAELARLREEKLTTETKLSVMMHGLK
jgi:hypothetical protein